MIQNIGKIVILLTLSTAIVCSSFSSHAESSAQLILLTVDSSSANKRKSEQITVSSDGELLRKFEDGKLHQTKIRTQQMRAISRIATRLLRSEIITTAEIIGCEAALPPSRDSLYIAGRLIWREDSCVYADHVAPVLEMDREWVRDVVFRLHALSR